MERPAPGRGETKRTATPPQPASFEAANAEFAPPSHWWRSKFHARSTFDLGCTRDRLFGMAPENRHLSTGLRVTSDALLGPLPPARPLDAAAVHRVRRSLKHARAVLRLVDDAGMAGAEKMRTVLGDVAHAIGPMRDAAVAARTAVKLERNAGKPVRLAARVVAKQAVAYRAASWWNTWWRKFERARQRLNRIAGAPLAEAQLRRAFRRSFRRACKRARRVSADDLERAHRWRKAVITLREQVDFLRPVLGKETDRLHDALQKVGRTLGVATDHQVLIAAAERHRWPPRLQKAADKLVATARKKQKRAIQRAGKRWRTFERRFKEKGRRALPSDTR